MPNRALAPALVALALLLGGTAKATPDGAVSVPAPNPYADSDPAGLAPGIAAQLRALAAAHRRRGDVFMKLGDSATVSRAFMTCFSDPAEVQLDGRDELSPTIEAFRDARVPGGDPYRRQSEAAAVGWRVHQVLRGTPSPLLTELRALSPRFALVMFGSNEIREGRLDRYRERMGRVVDNLLERGVLPILYNLPVRADNPSRDRLVPSWNRALADLAEERRVPLIDLHTAYETLPRHGLGSDLLHPSAPVREGRAHGCDFTPAGLRFGQNVRNLLTIELLHRLRAVLE